MSIKSSQSIPSAAQAVHRAVQIVFADPARSCILLVALVALIVVSPLWGLALSIMGWLAVRERVEDEGLLAIGCVLAPDTARLSLTAECWRECGAVIESHSV
ncbi:MAG: hypothetical protein R3C68_11960 [Myxococcota bacterium]